MITSAPAIWKGILLQGLKDDGYPWDWTTLGTVPQSRQAKARLYAKADGVWAGDGALQAMVDLSQDWHAPIEVNNQTQDGKPIHKGDLLSEWSGDARTLLVFERPVLNLAAYVSGVASQARQLVNRIDSKNLNTPPRVVPTRKTLPYLRDIAVYGVLMGGGYSHRLGLAHGVLIKENHIAVAGSIAQAIQSTRNSVPHGIKIETEVRSIEELKQAIQAEADGVLLDNFNPQQVTEALAYIQKKQSRLFVEVSGGIGESNIADYAQQGVDVISVGSLTHSVKALDFSLLIV